MSDNTSYQPLTYCVGQKIKGIFRITECYKRMPTFELFHAVHEIERFEVTLKIYYKSPKLSRIAQKEINLMKITNTIDFEHRYYPKFLGHEVDKDIWILIFQHIGPCLDEQIDNMRGMLFSLNTVRTIMWQVLHAIELVHENKIIVGNISTSKISLISDFIDQNGYELKSGERAIGVRINSLADAYDGTKWHIISHTPRAIQAPEAILQTRWSFETDLWAYGILLVELTTGKKLFQTDNILEHLALIEKVGGQFPMWMIDESPIQEAALIVDGHVDLAKLTTAQRANVEGYPNLETLITNESLLNLVLILLSTDPTLRGFPSVLIDHPFFTEIN